MTPPIPFDPLTPAELRDIAHYHAAVGLARLEAATGMGASPAADTFRRQAARHGVWSEQLAALAAALESKIDPQKSKLP